MKLAILVIVGILGAACAQPATTTSDQPGKLDACTPSNMCQGCAAGSEDAVNCASALEG